jgi:hypothetical protein
MLIIDIGTAGKWSGRRVAQSADKIHNKRWRVILANGQRIFVDDVTIVGEVGVDKPKEV